MAGHNKWSQIKHKKAKEDSKRGKAFTKLIKEITVSAREGGGDPAHNPRLRMLLEKGKEINMPIENATRAIKRGTGELPGVNYESITYEGYGPHGIAVIVDALTDNKNRTVAELRRIFSSSGGTLGDSGSVSWMFELCGVIRIASGNATEDSLLELLIDHDIKDIKIEDASTVIIGDPKHMETIKQTLLAAHYTVESAELEWVAKTPISIDQSQETKAFDFLSELQDHDDIKNVFTSLA